MTELDRLHEIADDIDRTAWGRELADALHVIAAHIGEEFDHMRDLSGYESDVMAWVEAYGGLDMAKEAVETSDDYRDTLNGVCKRLDLTDGTGLPERPGTMLAELERRLMPEGMEWPRFEDNEPVRIGDHWQQDGYDESITRIDSIEFAEDGIRFENEYADAFYRYGERVKRPTPKVLDADGAEIEVGDDLYSVDVGLKLHVGVIDTRNGKIATDAMFPLDKWADPAMYTHRAPVLAADGKPLREGEMVLGVDSGTRYTVEKVTDELIPIKCCSEMGSTVSLHPSQLTHERPVADTWERLEKDANKAVCIYFGVSTKACSECDHNSWECSFDKDHDLVRRAKALAERDA